MNRAEAPYSPTSDEGRKTPEITIEEGTRAYAMPLFSDRQGPTKGLAKTLGIREGLLRYTPPEVIQDRMNAFFRQITDQGGEIIGFHDEPTFNNLGEEICRRRFVVVRK